MRVNTVYACVRVRSKIYILEMGFIWIFIDCKNGSFSNFGCLINTMELLSHGFSMFISPKDGSISLLPYLHERSWAFIKCRFIVFACIFSSLCATWTISLVSITIIRHLIWSQSSVSPFISYCHIAFVICL